MSKLRWKDTEGGDERAFQKEKSTRTSPAVRGNRARLCSTPLGAQSGQSLKDVEMQDEKFLEIGYTAM